MSISSARASFRDYCKRSPILQFISRAPWRLTKWLFILCARLPYKKLRILRKLVFDTAPANSLLVSNGTSEIYIVSANDIGIGRRVYLDGSYDFWKFERALQLLGGGRVNDLLIDIGANIGTVCIPAVNRNIFKAAIAIEPDPTNFHLLNMNIQLNRLGKKINALNFALGDRDQVDMLFELSDTLFGDHRIRLGEDSGLCGEDRRRTITVKCRQFDRLIGTVNPDSTLIWSDTQGFEGYVLAGAQNALKSHTPLVLEFWPYGMKRSGCYKLLKQSLLAAGYQCFYDLEFCASAIPLTAAALDDLYARLGDTGSYTDILVR